MKRSLLLLFLLPIISLTPSPSFGSHGMVTVQSSDTVQDTADKLESAIEERNMKVFTRLDHAAGAAGIGETLRPTVLLIFGSPEAGTALMKCGQTAGIDLPLKMLVWEDSNGSVKVTYNDPRFIADRHGIADCGQVVEKMTGALKAFAEKATMKDGK